MIMFVKLGGSLITDKQGVNAFRKTVATRIAGEIASALDAAPDLRLLIGHGSGSFGHVVAHKYGTRNGVSSPEQWRGFAEVATTAAALNHLMAHALQSAGVPVWRVQPSASARSRDGQLVSMATHALAVALDQGIVPLVYGDVSLDEVRGGTIISTEAIFFYLAQHLAKHLPVSRILLLGEVDGVYDQAGVTIREITPSTLPDVEAALGGSAGTDVTGGMETKVRDMVALVSALPHLTIRILNGTQPDNLRRVLLDLDQPGTLIRAD